MNNHGFKAGLEIHQQLDSRTKLFCSCPTIKSSSFPLVIERRLRAVAGETGDIDIAARHEQKKNVGYAYHFNPESCCLVELDEEPPHPMSEDALEIALQIAKALHSDIMHEVFVMRKTVVDGSAVSGFQRTALLAMGGELKTSGGKVGIQTVNIEEDAAARLDAGDNKSHYALDRLGIPLIEIATGPDIKDPEHLYETAKALGTLMRATGRVKRGIGTIRQDINISIAKGNRVEIKGAQELDQFPLIAQRETERQLKLTEITGELKKRGARHVRQAPVELTHIFQRTACNILAKNKVYGIKLEKFAHLLGKELQPGRRFGTELSDYAKARGVKGILHSDENMEHYKITEEEYNAVRESLGITKDDAFVLVAAEGDKMAITALEEVVRRANMALDGVPKEVRKALPDGNTSYMRPLPGAARLYPETDLPPIMITPKKIRSIPLPPTPESIKKRLMKIGLNEHLADVMLASHKLHLFNRIHEETDVDDASLIANTLENTMVALKRDGHDIDSITNEQVVEVFKAYGNGLITRDGIPAILTAIASSKNKPLLELIKEKAASKTGDDEIRKIVRSKITHEIRKLHNPFAAVMGDVMKELRGKADGNLISKIVKEELETREP